MCRNIHTYIQVQGQKKNDGKIRTTESDILTLKLLTFLDDFKYLTSPLISL